MSDINDPTNSYDIPLHAPNDYDEGITEMAQKLAPLRGIAGGKNASPLKINRPNFRSVNDGLESAIKRLIEVEARVNALRGKLVGVRDTAENRPLPKPPSDDDSVFEQLDHRVTVLNQLLGSVSESIDIAKDAVS